MDNFYINLKKYEKIFNYRKLIDKKFEKWSTISKIKKKLENSKIKKKVRKF